MRIFSSAEVKARINKVDGTSAAGVDDIRQRDLLGAKKIIAIISLFNLVLQQRKTPKGWKDHRTVLIPKQEQENFRPITLGSLLMRVFTGWRSDQLQSRIKLSRAQNGLCLGESTALNAFYLVSA